MPVEWKSAPVPMMSFIGRLESATGASARDVINQQLLQQVYSKPKYLVIALDELTAIQEGDKLSTKAHYARSVLEKITPEKIQAHYHTSEENLSVSDMIDVAQGFDGVHDDISKAMLTGILTAPVELTKRAHKPDKQIAAQKYASDIGLIFVESLYALEKDTRLRNVMEFFYSNLHRPDLSNNTLFDLLFFTSLEGPREERYKANVVLKALNILFLSEFGEEYDIYKKNSIYQTRVHKDKLPTIWKEDIPYNMSMLDQRMNVIHDEVEAILDGSSDIKIKGVKAIMSANSESLGLANKAIATYCEMLGKKLQSKGYYWHFSIGPEGRPIFIVMDEKNYREKAYVQFTESALIQLLHRQNVPVQNVLLTQEEMDTILEYLKPPHDTEKAIRAVELKKLNTKLGLVGIGKRGRIKRFNRKEDKYLSKMGFSSIIFTQEQDTTKVVVRWGKWQFQFVINSENEPIGLEHISDSNKAFLLEIVYSYLESIKIPKGTIAQAIEREDDKEVDEGTTLDEKKGREPHVRVLHLGQDTGQMVHSVRRVSTKTKHVPRGTRELINQDIQLRSREALGIEIWELNTYFMQAQQNRNILNEFSPPLREVVEALLQRVELRPEKPVWKSIKVNGEEFKFLVVTKPELIDFGVGLSGDFIQYDENVHVYKLSFVSEKAGQSALPKTAYGNGVATKIKNEIGIQPRKYQQGENVDELD